MDEQNEALRKHAVRLANVLVAYLQKSDNKYLSVGIFRHALVDTYPLIRNLLDSKDCTDRAEVIIKSFFEVDNIIYMQDFDLLVCSCQTLLRRFVILNNDH
jgi:hypothetical protein